MDKLLHFFDLISVSSPDSLHLHLVFVTSTISIRSNDTNDILQVIVKRRGLILPSRPLPITIEPTPRHDLFIKKMKETQSENILSGGIIETFKAFCDYLKIFEPSPFLQWLEEVVSSGTSILDLSLYPGILCEAKSDKFVPMRPIISSIAHNEWFTSLIIDNCHRKSVMPIVSEMISLNSKLNMIKVSCGASDRINLIPKALVNNHFIRHLDLSGNPLNRFDKFIIPLIKSRVRILKLKNCSINPKAINKLCKIFSSDMEYTRRLICLDLSDNSIKEKGSKDLAKLFTLISKNTNRLTYLYISNTNSNLDIILKSIYSGFQFTELDLSSNPLDNGGTYLNKLIKNSKKLTYLSLELTGCGDTFQEISDEIIDNDKLTELKLNISHNDIPLTTLIELIDTNKLKKLVCNHIGLDSVGLTELFNSMNENNSISSLSVSGNHVEDGKVGSKLFLVVKNNTILQELDISHCNIGVALFPVLKQIGKHTSLKVFDISFNQIGDDGLEILGESLKTNKTITHIRFDDDVTEKYSLLGLRVIYSGLSQCKSLIEFERPKQIERNLRNRRNRLEIQRLAESALMTINMNRNTNLSISDISDSESSRKSKSRLSNIKINSSSFQLSIIDEQKEMSDKLLYLLENGNTDKVVKYLQKNPEEIKSIDNESGQSLIHIFSKKADHITLSYLLSSGAANFVNTTDHQGMTPLLCLVQSNPDFEGGKGCILLLQDYGANFKATDRRGWNTVQIGVSRQIDEKIIILLIKSGANPNQPDNRGMTSIHRAAASGFSEHLSVLLQNGGDVNTHDLSLSTPLHRAARNGHEECVVELIIAGADKSLTDNKQLTPLDLARLYGHPKIVKLLDPLSLSRNDVIFDFDNEYEDELDSVIGDGHLEYSCAVMGPSKVGKTKLVMRFTTFLYNDEPVHVVEKSHTKCAIVDGVRIILKITDTTGDPVYEAFRSKWIKESDGFLVCYNAINEIPNFINKIVSIKNKPLEEIPIILVRTKEDEDISTSGLTNIPEIDSINFEDTLIPSFSDISIPSIMDIAHVPLIQNEYDLPDIDTSAKANTNVDIVFAKIITEIKKKIDKPFVLIEKRRFLFRKLSSINISNINTDLSFEEIISNSSHNYVFVQFLRSEYAEENLMFYLAVTAFKGLEEGTEDVKLIAESIVNDYIKDGSKHQINIDYDVRNNILSKIDGDVSISIFDEAVIMIMELLRNDSYPKFLKSNFYNQLTSTEI